jgi:hypothetical protein
VSVEAVGDIFKDKGLKPVRVTITAGTEESINGVLRYSVPKQVLISRLDAAMHLGEPTFAKELREAPALEQEMKNFNRHVTEAGRYVYGAREGQHDDLVLAVAIALWRATKRKINFSRPSKPPRVILGYADAKGRRE